VFSSPKGTFHPRPPFSPCHKTLTVKEKFPAIVRTSWRHFWISPTTVINDPKRSITSAIYASVDNNSMTKTRGGSNKKVKRDLGHMLS